MKGYDYSKDNLYFVTICVDKMQCFLGDIVACNDEIIENSNSQIEFNRSLNLDSDWVGTSRDLSVQGENANCNIQNDSDLDNPKIESIPNLNPSHQIMRLNDFGEIVLKRLHWLEDQYKYVLIHNHVVMPNHVHVIIEIDRLLIPDIGIKIKSLSELIGAFKSTSLKLIHYEKFSDFKWKRSFHDHIIRDEQSFQNISNYIINNPSNWKLDSLHPTRLKV